MNLTIKMVTTAAALFLSMNAVQSIMTLTDSWDNKITSQRNNFYQVSTSRDEWRELATFRHQWPRLFAEESTASISRHELFKELKLSNGIKPSVSRINHSTTTSVQSNNQVIGLSQTCVQNESNGFVVSADNLTELFFGLRRLEARREVSFSELSLINTNGKPQVVIRNLCIYFRTGGL